QLGDVFAVDRQPRAHGGFRKAPRAVQREAPVGELHGEVARPHARVARDAERGAGRQREVEVLDAIARQRASAAPGDVRDRALLDPDACSSTAGLGKTTRETDANVTGRPSACEALCAISVCTRGVSTAYGIATTAAIARTATTTRAPKVHARERFTEGACGALS